MEDQTKKAAPVNRIRQKLNGRDLSWLSRETGISLSTLSDYQRGKLPRVDKAILVAHALDTNVEWLFVAGADSEPTPSAGSFAEREEQMLLNYFRKLPEESRRHTLANMNFLLHLVRIPYLGEASDTQKTLHSPNTNYRGKPQE
jgi:transcriptional regulator with XRE-family HTH domain